MSGPRAFHSRLYDVAMANFDWDDMWSLFDGSSDRLNIAEECLDRHRDKGTAVRLRAADGSRHELTFSDLSTLSSQYAHHLEALGIRPGDAVGVMVEPSRDFYGAIFGVMKRGAVAVPMYTLFGPEALQARLGDCRAVALIVDAEHASVAHATRAPGVLVVGPELSRTLANLPSEYQTRTSSRDLAVLQYTSGTNKTAPTPIPHNHRAIVTVTLAGICGLGLAEGDRLFCPSSPAWGHGLWHGTIAPLALGIATGSYAGKFRPDELVAALNAFQINNIAAAGTVYRMLLKDGLIESVPPLLKASYTGEAIDSDTLATLRSHLKVPVCGMYGTTETGVILANFPGFADHEVIDGALGKPLPGHRVAVIDDDGNLVPAGRLGEIAVERLGRWFRSRDLGWIDSAGYFWYSGRADDVIISAGWTISPLEVEAVIDQHPDVLESAVVGVPDAARGQIVKAFVVSQRDDVRLRGEIQDLVRYRLSPHEYPREVEVVRSLPRTFSGKINRRDLRVRDSSGDDELMPPDAPEATMTMGESA